MSKKIPEVVNDKIGQEIRVGSIVAAPHTRTLLIVDRVTKIMPKQLKIESVEHPGNRYNPTWNKNHDQVLCLDGLDETVMFLMTRNL